MKKLAALTLSLFLVSGTALADTPKDAEPQPATPKAAKAKKTEKADSALAVQIEELRQAVQSQQEQLQLLKEELSKRDRQIDEAREAAAAANAKAAEATSKANEAVNASSEVRSVAATLNTTVSDLNASNEILKTTVAKEQTEAKKAEETGPASIKYKGITITPGGFFAAETVWRQRAVSGDVNTPFTAIPFPGNSLSKVAENNFSGRSTRPTLLAEAKIGNAKVTAYLEADFLGAGTTSNNRQSNSYVFRQRQVWAQAAFENGWSLTGGQMWSLATETKKGIQNRQETPPLVIDHQYNVGFTWARQYGFRVVKDFGGKFALGLSIEGPQATIGGRGFNTLTNTSATGVATVSQNFFINAPGAGGGLFNAFDAAGYSVNKAPDFLFKAAADPGWGHYELFGIVSTFRNRVFPCAVVGTNAGNLPAPATPTVVSCPVDGSLAPSSLGAFDDTRTGGGFGASARVPLLNKKLEVALKGFAGDGVGRYGSAQIADLTFRPDGTQALVRTAHGLASLELHPNPKLDVYAYFGGEYGFRAPYAGYTTITVTNTPGIPATGVGGPNPTPAIPATSKTTISQTGIGGYGSPFANNSGCSTEVAPAGTSAPGSGGRCAGDIRDIFEGSVGFWHKLYQGPKGRFQWGIQYSYLTKNGWSGNNGSANPVNKISPKAVDNMVLTSFRYYIP